MVLEEQVRDEENIPDEDAPDWSQLHALIRGRKLHDGLAFIPKKGEKDFEPRLELAAVQRNALDAARDAMYSALQAGQARQHSSKAHNRAIWHPQLSRASISSTHGIHFTTMGHHSTQRARTELLPEEVLYLVERGTLECWTLEGVPMSAQQTFAQVLGTDDLTPERYQVYAYLKRLGYSIQRAALGYRPPVLAPESASNRPNVLSLIGRRIMNALLKSLKLVLSTLRLIDTEPAYLSCNNVTRRLLSQTLRRRSLLEDVRWTTYKQAFEAIRVIPSGHAELRSPKTATKDDLEAFESFWHVYKPITKYKKSRPGPPDFYLAVVDARSVGMPSIEQLSRIFAALPSTETPPAPIRKGISLAHLRQTCRDWWRPKRKPLPYGALKRGNKTFVVAAVDAGTSTFVRFTETDFAKHSWV